MKKILLGLICTLVVISCQLPTNKVTLAGSVEIQKEFSLVAEKFSEEASKEPTEKPIADKPVDGKTGSTKKKY